MRILTVRQPWAWAIMHGGKDVENRGRNIAGDYRGPVAIHVGLRDDLNAFSDLDRPDHTELDLAADRFFEEMAGEHSVHVPTPWWTQHGHIIGVVDLTEVHWSGMECSRGHSSCHEYGLCSPWAEAYVQHLVLANPRPLANPIPFKGALGLRHLDEATIAQINEGLK